MSSPNGKCSDQARANGHVLQMCTHSDQVCTKLQAPQMCTRSKRALHSYNQSNSHCHCTTTSRHHQASSTTITLFLVSVVSIAQCLVAFWDKSHLGRNITFCYRLFTCACNLPYKDNRLLKLQAALNGPSPLCVQFGGTSAVLLS